MYMYPTVAYLRIIINSTTSVCVCLFLKQEETSCMNIFQGSYEATKVDLGSSRIEHSCIFQDPMQGFRCLNEKMGLESMSFQDEGKCSVLLTAACNSDNRRESPRSYKGIKGRARKPAQRRQF